MVRVEPSTQSLLGVLYTLSQCWQLLVASHLVAVKLCEIGAAVSPVLHRRKPNKIQETYSWLHGL